MLESGDMVEIKRGYTASLPSDNYLRVYLNSDNDMECDDVASQSVNSIGDFWKVFVR